MESRGKIKKVFAPQSILRAFFTGGVLELIKDEWKLFCQCSGHICVVDIQTGNVIQTIPSGLEDCDASEADDKFEDSIFTFSLSKDRTCLATAHKSGLIQTWIWKDAKVEKTWKSVHKGPISKLSFNNDGSMLVSGGTDSCLRVWDPSTAASLVKLGGIQGVISILEFSIVKEKELLFASGNDGVIFVWSADNIRQKNLIFKLTGHFSVVTNILISNDSNYLLSSSRDKVIIIWNLETGSKVRTLPVYESIETAVLLPDCVHLPGYTKPVKSQKGALIAVAGEQGMIHVYDALKGQLLFDFQIDNSSAQKMITNMIYNKEENYLLVATADQNISLYNVDDTFSCRKQLVGCSDEILDLTYFGENESYLAVAVNGNNVNLYDRNMNCTLLKGHTDLVICLDSSLAYPNLLVSGSKDNSVRVWMMKDNDVNCVAIGSRHTASVTSVAISTVSSQIPFIVSVSEDMTIKLWHLRDLKFKKTQTLNISKTGVAHDKPINSVCISPNDKLIATASQDKTAKVWSVHDMSLVGTLKGHRRGLWCVKFSPIDQVLITSSADTTLRLWSVADYSCLKTFEGHDSSVLKCCFINNGLQFVSCSSDGLVKVWLIKSGECVVTLDKHSAKIWAIKSSADSSHFITGGADSRLIVWHDKTEEEMIKLAKEKRDIVDKEQHLTNLLNANQLLPALELALTLNRPKNALKIIEGIIEDNQNVLQDLVLKLSVDQKEKLLSYVCSWNTSSKYCYVAQVILSIMRDELLDGKINISDNLLTGAIAYTDRHFKRMTKLLQDQHIIAYTERIMQPHSEQSG